MPLSGTLDYAPGIEGAPLLARTDTEEWTLPRAEVVYMQFEIGEEAMTNLLPPALHPTIPPTLNLVGWRVPESPAGAFSLLDVRIGARIAVRPRGYSIAAFCDNPHAAAELRDRWGYSISQGSVEIRHLYDRSVIAVDGPDGEILRAELIDPTPISGNDILYTASMHLARVNRDGNELPRLVQVDPGFAFHKAERGHPELLLLDDDACALPGVRVTWPVSASYSVCDITVPRLRYLVDPAVEGGRGTESV